MSFEEQVLVIREKLADLYKSEQQWSKAAQILSGMDLDSTVRVIDDTSKLSKCVQIARLYLEDDDAVRKQAAITLRYMQVLVRVQAHVYARHVRLALESQAAQQKLQQQLAMRLMFKKLRKSGAIV